MNQPYDDRFYSLQQEGSLRTAREIVPLVIELIRPGSVVDVGCGVGVWLSAFREHGVEDTLGIDGDYVNRGMLRIPADGFMAMDLQRPVVLDRQFDLVVSLEVAEHLPPESADTFVGSLVGLGPVVLFSAAIPFQGGINHLNEQWPDYWARIFRARGYAAIDCLRDKIWQNENVDWWYAQNLLLFTSEDYLETNQALKRHAEKNSQVLPLVHPMTFLKYADPDRMWSELFLRTMKTFPTVMKDTIKRKLSKLFGKG